jgi:hypothetical protein
MAFSAGWAHCALGLTDPTNSSGLTFPDERLPLRFPFAQTRVTTPTKPKILILFPGDLSKHACLY